MVSTRFTTEPRLSKTNFGSLIINNDPLRNLKNQQR